MRSRAVFAVLALTLAGCPAAKSSDSKIQLKGSDTMNGLGNAWAEAWTKMRPEVSIAVTGGGSGTGIAALANGTCDIAQCSRAMKDKERADIEKATGKKPMEHSVAIDALVVAVNPKNPVASLTFEQLSDIFTGKVTNWKDVGGSDAKIVVVSRDKSSGTHVYFLEHVLRKGNDKGPEEYATSALMLASSQAIVTEVESNEGAIGYYGLGYLDAKKNKALSVAKKTGEKPVLPSAEAALDGSYPIARPLYFYTLGEPAGAVKGFVDFVLSDEGQKIVRKQEFVPLRALKEG
jgi:phosphate transport system substrate-binding protein